MNTDSRGHALTTSNPKAAQSCAVAMDHYMQRRSDVVDHLKLAIKEDPECAIAHATLGLMMHGAKHVGIQPLVGKSLEKAKQFSSGTNEREQLYIEALSHASAGQLTQSIACYQSILEQYPTDGFALSLCQSELFWLGDMQQSLAVSSSVASHWNESIAGYGDFLAMHAFDLEEAGDFAKAEKCGRKAVELNQSNVWAAHAVAHVLYMQGRHTEGVDWIAGVQDHWDGIGQIQFHVWWHKCLCHLELGEHDAVLEGYDQWVRNTDHALVQSMPDLYIDLQNGASLLWRLEHAGINVGARWNEMAELVRLRFNDFSSPFTSAHFALILAAVGDFNACDQLVEAMQEFAASNDMTLTDHYSKGAIPAAQAAIAHRQKDYKRVVELLYPARFNLGMMGGSHAQQDIFFQLLLDAAAQMQNKPQVESLLAEIEQIGFVEPQQLMAYRVICEKLN